MKNKDAAQAIQSIKDLIQLLESIEPYVGDDPFSPEIETRESAIRETASELENELIALGTQERNATLLLLSMELAAVSMIDNFDPNAPFTNKVIQRLSTHLLAFKQEMQLQQQIKGTLPAGQSMDF